MALDRTLVKEIKAANGDGSREAKFTLLRKIDAAAKDMSTPEIRERFSEMLVRHGRAVTAICIAATLWIRRERLDDWQIPWAMEVLEHWTTKPKSETGISRAYIDDQIHPTHICEYAASFIKCTTEG
jgi:hypothetical protein